ncbi:hypothetical protein D1007_41043 [Hordeum vulgare]|uniref:Predicted protein n=1 Tax=Hordeum vulgare subsp. vulgare TaxID=112509 RepID=F2DD39_HORVV|nr:hypothetical protein D1007_41043 [Hordeum vulgare]BAJ93010.1 predicted protein [Hordeum vulgare subsp. vulgare]
MDLQRLRIPIQVEFLAFIADEVALSCIHVASSSGSGGRQRPPLALTSSTSGAWADPDHEATAAQQRDRVSPVPCATPLQCPNQPSKPMVSSCSASLSSLEL